MKLQTLIPILKSWETGYISPSAQIAIRDAIEALLAQEEKISELEAKVSELEDKLLNQQLVKKPRSKPAAKADE